MQLRCSNFMGCTLEERVALILLELSENFGMRDRQGVRLTVPARHQDLAELVGASRPRVTEYLTSFERKHLIVRDGRQLIVRRDRLERFLDESDSSANRWRVWRIRCAVVFLSGLRLLEACRRPPKRPKTKLRRER